MKKALLILLLALAAGCTPDEIPHCSRCNRKYAQNHPGKDTTYLLCDKTYREISAWEIRENAAHPNSTTDCTARDTTK